MPRDKQKNKPPHLPPVPKNWNPGPFDFHDFVVYQCGCNYHRVYTQTEQGTKRCKWLHCPKHQQKLEESFSKMNAVWNSILNGPTVSMRRSASLQTVTEEKKE